MKDTNGNSGYPFRIEENYKDPFTGHTGEERCPSLDLYYVHEPIIIEGVTIIGFAWVYIEDIDSKEYNYARANIISGSDIGAWMSFVKTTGKKTGYNPYGYEPVCITKGGKLAVGDHRLNGHKGAGKTLIWCAILDFDTEDRIKEYCLRENVSRDRTMKKNEATVDDIIMNYTKRINEGSSTLEATVSSIKNNLRKDGVEGDHDIIADKVLKNLPNTFKTLINTIRKTTIERMKTFFGFDSEKELKDNNVFAFSIEGKADSMTYNRMMMQTALPVCKGEDTKAVVKFNDISGKNAHKTVPKLRERVAKNFLPNVIEWCRKVTEANNNVEGLANLDFYFESQVEGEEGYFHYNSKGEFIGNVK